MSTVRLEVGEKAGAMMASFWGWKRLLRSSLMFLMIVLLLPLLQFSKVHADDFVLLESYPAQGQILETSALVINPIYLKFNHRVRREDVGLLKLYDKTEYSICQLNQCGIVEYAENDTKVIWHPDNPSILFAPGKSFAIQIGGLNPPESPVLFQDIDGNALPLTYVDFEIDKCQPTVRLQLSGNTYFICPHCIDFCVDYSFVIGDTITLTIWLANPDCGSNLEVEGKVWVELPDGSLLSVLDPHAVIKLNPGDNFSVDLATYKFLGHEPLGRYKAGFRVVHPVTGIITAQHLPFSICNLRNANGQASDTTNRYRFNRKSSLFSFS